MRWRSWIPGSCVYQAQLWERRHWWPVTAEGCGMWNLMLPGTSPPFSYHSLVGESSIVCFNGKQVYPEYLVAYRSQRVSLWGLLSKSQGVCQKCTSQLVTCHLMYDGAGAFSAPANWNLNDPCVSTTAFHKKPNLDLGNWTQKKLQDRFSFAWDSICCMDDQICFAASVALKTFVQFQFRFQSLTSRSLTGTLGFNLVKMQADFTTKTTILPKHKVHRWKNSPKITKKSPQNLRPKSSLRSMLLRGAVGCSVGTAATSSWCSGGCSMWCDFLWDLFQIALNCYVVCICLLLKNSDVALGSMYQDPTLFLHFWSNVLPMINAEMLWTAATSQHLMSFVAGDWSQWIAGAENCYQVIVHHFTSPENG